MRIDFYQNSRLLFFWVVHISFCFYVRGQGPFLFILLKQPRFGESKRKEGVVSAVLPPTLSDPGLTAVQQVFDRPSTPFRRSSLRPTNFEKNSVLHKSSTLVKAWRCINKREAERCLYKKEASSSGSLSIVGASLVRNQHGKDELNVGFAPSCPLRSCRFVLLPRHEIHRLAITRLEI